MSDTQIGPMERECERWLSNTSGIPFSTIITAAREQDATQAALVAALHAAKSIVADRASGGRMLTSTAKASAVHRYILAALAAVRGDGVEQ